MSNSAALAGLLATSENPTRKKLVSYLKIPKGTALPNEVALFTTGDNNVSGDVLPQKGRHTRILGINLIHNIVIDGADAATKAQARKAFEDLSVFKYSIAEDVIESGSITDLLNYDTRTTVTGTVEQDFRASIGYAIPENRLRDIPPGDDISVNFTLTMPQETTDSTATTVKIGNHVGANDFYIRVELDVETWKNTDVVSY